MDDLVHWLSVFFGEYYFYVLHRGEFRTGLSAGHGSLVGGFWVLAFILSSLVAAHLLSWCQSFHALIYKKKGGVDWFVGKWYISLAIFLFNHSARDWGRGCE